MVNRAGAALDGRRTTGDELSPEALRSKAIRQMRADIGDSVLAGQPYPTAHTGLAKGAICSGKNSTARVVLL